MDPIDDITSELNILSVNNAPATIFNLTCIDYELSGVAFKYYPKFLHPQLADYYFETFMRYVLPQDVLQTTDLRETLTTDMRELRDQIFGFTGHTFDSCLVNYKIDNNNFIRLYSDKGLSSHTTIASILLGAPKFFDAIPQISPGLRIFLEHGSLLLAQVHPCYEYNITHATGSCIIVTYFSQSGLS